MKKNNINFKKISSDIATHYRGGIGADVDISKLPKEERRRIRNLKIVRWMWSIFLGIGLTGFIFCLLIYNGVIGYMPPIEELKNPRDKFASILYAGDGQTEIGRYYTGAGNRVYAEYNDISQNMVNALIATEDARFFEHSGIDFPALGRVLLKTVLMGDRSSGGGSTITQQLAKQLYSDNSDSKNILKRAVQKPVEMMIAVKLERFYTKDEIIKMYLNRFDFLNNAVGIKTAAKVYFNKLPKDLTVPESAMLVGMLKNPSYYNPLRHPERVKERRNVVLDQMVKAGSLSTAEAETYKQQELGLNYRHVDQREQGLPYVRDEIRFQMTAKKPVKPSRADYKSDYAYKMALGKFNTDSTAWQNNALYGWIEKNPKPDGSLYDIYSDGLRIYTTIDMKMQKYAEEAVNEHLGGTLQPNFSSEKRGLRYGPYTTDRSELSEANVQKIIRQAKRQTARYYNMKAANCSNAEIDRAFNTPHTMRIFAWVRENGKLVPGSKEVTMTPMDSLMYMKSILRAGMVSIDPITGFIKAYVGGPDYKYFQYDMVSTGRRQIGSTVKPFLYTLAMENGYTPCSQFSNTRVNFGGWSPRGGGGGGMMDLRTGLTTSNNTISARLIDVLRPANLVKELRIFGLTGYIEPSYPLCLGTCDISVREMVGAYTAFANYGIRVEPLLVSRIEDSKGNVIADFVPHRTEVISETAYFRILSMLMNVIDNGTGRGLRGTYNLSGDMGGKTGTTNSNSDLWFIGFTPELVTGIWVGGEERYIHFNTMALGQGAKGALPIFGKYMNKVYADRKLPYSSQSKFIFPENLSICGDGQRYTGSSSQSGNNDDEGAAPEGDIPGLFD